MINPPRVSKSLAHAQLVGAVVREITGCEVRVLMAPSFELKRISDREITCWPESRAAGFATRAANVVDTQVGICVLERMPPTEDEDILADELLALVESIGDQMIGAVIVTDDSSAPLHVLGYEHQPLYDRDLLEANRIFGAGIFLNLQRHEERTTYSH